MLIRNEFIGLNDIVMTYMEDRYRAKPGTEDEIIIQKPKEVLVEKHDFYKLTCPFCSAEIDSTFIPNWDNWYHCLDCGNDSLLREEEHYEQK